MNQPLQRSRQDIDTPALIIDLDRMERNIATMAAFFRGVEANLRPHIKTHKTPEIALRQLEAGAIGVTCAKVGEAEVMADAGVRDLLIANQIVGSRKIRRLMEVARRAEVMVAVDDPANVAELSEAAQQTHGTLCVLVEVDVGMSRCGVPPGEPAVELAKRVERSKGLIFKGVMGYEGHTVIIPQKAVRTEAAHAAMKLLTDTAEAIRTAGLPVEIVSAGGTGTYDITGTYPGVTEVQAGSYVLMDTTYRAVEGVGGVFECALTLLTTVVSRPAWDRVIVDIGLKTVTRDFGLPEMAGIEGLQFLYLSEEHGKIRALSENIDLKPGDRIEVLPNHVCTTVNLHDQFYGVRDGKVEAVWEIKGRGKSQ